MPLSPDALRRRLTDPIYRTTPESRQSFAPQIPNETEQPIYTSQPVSSLVPVYQQTQRLDQAAATQPVAGQTAFPGGAQLPLTEHLITPQYEQAQTQLQALPRPQSVEEYDFNANYDAATQNLMRELARERSAYDIAGQEEAETYGRGKRGLEQQWEDVLEGTTNQFAERGILRSGIFAGEEGKIGTRYQGDINQLTEAYNKSRGTKERAFTDFRQRMLQEMDRLKLERAREQRERESARARTEAEAEANRRAAEQAIQQRNQQQQAVQQAIQQQQPVVQPTGQVSPGPSQRGTYQGMPLDQYQQTYAGQHPQISVHDPNQSDWRRLGFTSEQQWRNAGAQPMGATTPQFQQQIPINANVPDWQRYGFQSEQQWRNAQAPPPPPSSDPTPVPGFAPAPPGMRSVPIKIGATIIGVNYVPR